MKFMAPNTYLDNTNALRTSLPSPDGFFGDENVYGDAFLPPPLEPVMQMIAEEYSRIRVDPDFLNELSSLHKAFIGRPSPIYHCKSLSTKLGGAQIYLETRRSQPHGVLTRSITAWEKLCWPRKWASRV